MGDEPQQVPALFGPVRRRRAGPLFVLAGVLVVVVLVVRSVPRSFQFGPRGRHLFGPALRYDAAAFHHDDVIGQ